MKSLTIPYIPDLEKLEFKELEAKLESGGTKSAIDSVCWPEEFPYAPDVSFTVAHSTTHLSILYAVSGLDLRAIAMEDNGRVWEDSCCEFFVSDPSDGTYYNFEMNCIGTLLAAKRKSREDCSHFSSDKIGKIRRFSSLSKRPVEEKNKLFSWKIALCIPFELIGITGGKLPDSLRANFYKCGDKTAHPHFLSWNQVKTEHPDFHRPEFFGEIKFDTSNRNPTR